jgi:hypothetical protein
MTRDSISESFTFEIPIIKLSFWDAKSITCDFVQSLSGALSC